MLFRSTACKATSPEHAIVRIYDTLKWHLVGEPLAGHTLTVTRISFSPDDRYVLTVSRDRTWRLFERQSPGGKFYFAEDSRFCCIHKVVEGYHPIVTHKSHARIIWDCDWTREGDAFATASRDKSVWP